MIDKETKTKLISELEKTGIISVACLRAGISRAIYYHWLKSDHGFRKKALRSLKLGRENANELVEHSVLTMATKDKNLGAAKYWLSNNSPRYRLDRYSKALIHHTKQLPPPDPEQPTMEDFIQRVEKMSQEIANDMLREHIEKQEREESENDIIGPLGP